VGSKSLEAIIKQRTKVIAFYSQVFCSNNVIFPFKNGFQIMEGQKYVSEYLTRPALFFCIVCGSHSLTLRGKNCDALSSYQLHRGSLA